MSMLATDERETARWAVLFAAFLVSLGACRGSHPPPPLKNPSASKPVAQRKPAEEEPSYRSAAGTPIAPTVIADDPAPTPAHPTSDNKPGQKATLNGDPNGITRESLNQAVQGAMGSLAACFSSLTEDPMVSVAFEADPSGKPSLVRVNGAPSDAERCIRNVVQNIHFPSFEGKGVQVDLPLSFHRVAGSGQQAKPASEEPAPGTAPLFLQP